MSVAVTVIVPVYNAEKYLEVCLNSIIRQSLENIEIIIVNDGSTDNSKSIIENFAHLHNRIIFIDQKNGGVSAARNAGLNKASGKYIGFVDADDYVQENMYEEMYKQALSHGSSMVISNAKEQNKNAAKGNRLNFEEGIKSFSYDKKMFNSFIGFKYDYSNWNKIYDHSIIKANKLLFNEQLYIWEDLLFNLQFLNFSKVITSLNKPLYNYRIHDASIIANSKTHLALQYNLFYKAYLAFAESYSLDKSLKWFKDNRAATCVSNIFTLITLRSAGNLNFASVYNKFKNEIKNLNADIFKDFSQIRTDSKFYQLLYLKKYKLFALLYTAEQFLKMKYAKIRSKI